MLTFVLIVGLFMIGTALAIGGTWAAHKFLGKFKIWPE